MAQRSGVTEANWIRCSICNMVSMGWSLHWAAHCVGNSSKDLEHSCSVPSVFYRMVVLTSEWEQHQIQFCCIKYGCVVILWGSTSDIRMLQHAFFERLDSYGKNFLLHVFKRESSFSVVAEYFYLLKIKLHSPVNHYSSLFIKRSIIITNLLLRVFIIRKDLTRLQ